MFQMSGRCNFFDVRNGENRLVEFSDAGLLEDAYPDSECLSISSGPLTGIPLLGANVWEINCYNPCREMVGHSFGTGALGTVQKLAGFDRVVIYGSCARASLILIRDEGCQVREVPDFGGWEDFNRYVAGIMGEIPYGILMKTDTGLATRGLVLDSVKIVDFLGRHNIVAIVAGGKGRIKLAEPDLILGKSLEISRRWHNTGLKGGSSGCFACHGRCDSLLAEGVSMMPVEQRELFVALGVCPQLLLQGAIISLADLIDFLKYTTGKLYTEQELWDFCRRRGKRVR